MKNIIIAIDGHSSCGKSTLAKMLSKQIGYAYIDTGAMYRAVTLYFIQQQIDVNEASEVKRSLPDIRIHFEAINGKNTTFLNAKNVEETIRGMEVSALVSEVAALPIVRRKMVEQQYLMGKQKSIVMDGRDIGTVVFPDAELKLFVTASLPQRTQRRFLELKKKGKEVSYDEVSSNLQHRDHIDSTRADSPLRQAEDAVFLDNTNLTIEEQLAMVEALVKLRRKD